MTLFKARPGPAGTQRSSRHGPQVPASVARPGPAEDSRRHTPQPDRRRGPCPLAPPRRAHRGPAAGPTPLTPCRAVPSWVGRRRAAQRSPLPTRRRTALRPVPRRRRRAGTDRAAGLPGVAGGGGGVGGAGGGAEGGRAAGREAGLEEVELPPVPAPTPPHRTPRLGGCQPGPDPADEVRRRAAGGGQRIAVAGQAGPIYLPPTPPPSKHTDPPAAETRGRW